MPPYYSAVARVPIEFPTLRDQGCDVHILNCGTAGASQLIKSFTGPQWACRVAFSIVVDRALSLVGQNHVAFGAMVACLRAQLRTSYSQTMPAQIAGSELRPRTNRIFR